MYVNFLLCVKIGNKDLLYKMQSTQVYFKGLRLVQPIWLAKAIYCHLYDPSLFTSSTSIYYLLRSIQSSGFLSVVFHSKYASLSHLQESPGNHILFCWHCETITQHHVKWWLWLLIYCYFVFTINTTFFFYYINSLANARPNLKSKINLRARQHGYNQASLLLGQKKITWIDDWSKLVWAWTFLFHQ